MAPTPQSDYDLDIADLVLSSLELDSRASQQESSPINLPLLSPALKFVEREALIYPDTNNALGPISLFKRDPAATPTSTNSPTPQTSVNTATITALRSQTATPRVKPSAGAIAPDEFNNKGIQALFALIGVGFVLVAIWFFFWAKNGGFQWRKGDWDEYKSTVMRRKGPNGTTLSNATKSTRLGGGSIVGQGYSDHDGSTVSGRDDNLTVTDLSSEAPVLKEKQRNKKSKKPKSKNSTNNPFSPENIRNTNYMNEKGMSADETNKERKLRDVQEARWEGGRDDDVRAYRHERVARVGGINRDSDAQHYGTDYSGSAHTSDVSRNSRQRHDHSQQQPDRNRHSGHKSPRHSSPEKHHSSTQQRQKHQYTNPYAPSPSPNTSSRPARYHSPSKAAAARDSSYMPGSFAGGQDLSDVQSQYTKSYHHPIAGLSGGRGSGGNGGFRRGRDDLDD